ncbi:DUF2634 domain-containing protein [Blautia sp. HCP3S3_C12]|uniref:DUF2634 domain-containing protein n=1 Tax=unclassified Blautia TaxID=2648079 RepID=UPI003F8910CC
MMFPFTDNEEEEEQEESLYIPREYGINFETGQLSGKIVEGYDALLVWAWLALQTPRYRYYIYSENYGQEYEDLIGKSYSTELTDSELERMTEECLTENPYITGIENFSCVKIEEKVTVTFSLITELGDGEVSIDV